ncbi:Uncharacterised protein [uncultured archaeon]|nr:Uncharacterised protein [uncultured archaeon]
MIKNLLILGILGVLIGFSAFSGCIRSGTGQLVLNITDAPGDLNITRVNVTISKVMVHRSAAVNNTTAGWEIIVNDSQTFDLISLINVKEFFGSANLSVGMYTQIRLTVESCVITVNGTEYNCTVPSGKIKLIKPFVLMPDQTITLTMDFDVQKSITEKGNNKYTFNPVIKVIRD